FVRYPDAVARSVEIADTHGFSLRQAKPKLPKLDVDEQREMATLRKLVWDGVAEKYPNADRKVRDRIGRELDVIATLGYPGYFLIVHGIVEYANYKGILCQGRGSAAN